MREKVKDRKEGGAEEGKERREERREREKELEKWSIGKGERIKQNLDI